MGGGGGGGGVLPFIAAWGALTIRASITWHDPLLWVFSSRSRLVETCYRAEDELISSQGLQQPQVQHVFQLQFKLTMFRKEGGSIHNLSRLQREIPFWGLRRVEVSALSTNKGIQGARGGGGEIQYVYIRALPRIPAVSIKCVLLLLRNQGSSASNLK